MRKRILRMAATALIFTLFVAALVGCEDDRTNGSGWGTSTNTSTETSTANSSTEKSVLAQIGARQRIRGSCALQYGDKVYYCDLGTLYSCATDGTDVVNLSEQIDWGNDGPVGVQYVWYVANNIIFFSDALFANFCYMDLDEKTVRYSGIKPPLCFSDDTLYYSAINYDTGAKNCFKITYDDVQTAIASKENLANYHTKFFSIIDYTIYAVIGADENYLYYVNMKYSLTNKCSVPEVYRIRHDGSEDLQLIVSFDTPGNNEDSFEDAFLCGDWIVYRHMPGGSPGELRKMRLDGTEDQIIVSPDEFAASWPFFSAAFDDSIFFIANGGIAERSIDGGNYRIVRSGVGPNVLEIRPELYIDGDLEIAGDYIYFHGHLPAADGDVYRCRIDGTGEIEQFSAG
jgi:hypothetical protein